MQFPWEPRPNRFHSQYLSLKPYYIDIAPVTQAEFAAYLQKAGGVKALPADRYHYLQNWDWSGAVPKPGPGNETLPVTYIGFAEAKAYCAGLGKRLPSSVEWQYAGQGNAIDASGEALAYPWGPKDNATLHPTMTTGNIFYGPEPVDRYSPAGDSAFGLQSMVGNVWQYTSVPENAAPFCAITELDCLKREHLPRQARDEHKEKLSKKTTAYAGVCGWPHTIRAPAWGVELPPQPERLVPPGDSAWYGKHLVLCDQNDHFAKTGAGQT